MVLPITWLYTVEASPIRMGGRPLKPTTEDLVTRAAGHDLSAFEELVRRFSDAAITYACAILRDYHAAEDATQEAFLTVWRNLGDLREPSAFEGWESVQSDTVEVGRRGRSARQ